ncbi:hypothetical protein DSECCO2_598640 [anaerobic digester metagenome]
MKNEIVFDVFVLYYKLPVYAGIHVFECHCPDRLHIFQSLRHQAIVNAYCALIRVYHFGFIGAYFCTDGGHIHAMAVHGRFFLAVFRICLVSAFFRNDFDFLENIGNPCFGQIEIELRRVHVKQDMIGRSTIGIGDLPLVFEKRGRGFAQI